MRATFRLLTLASIAVVFSSVACAQDARVEPLAGAYRGWDGKAVARACRADLHDLAGLKQALLAHEFTRVGFKRKLMFGLFGVGSGWPQDWMHKAEPSDLLERIVAQLRRIGKDRPTAALIYDVGLAEGRHSLCAWLVTGDGLAAAATTELPVRSLTHWVQADLRVAARAVTRAPTPRAPGRPIGSAVGRGHVVAAASSPGDSARDALAAVARVVMPPAIEAELATAQIDRILILTPGDLSTLPFAALPVNGEPLIERAAIVMLADVSGLFVTGDSLTHRTGAKLIVGDPDTAGDRAWRFAPLEHARSEAEEVARIAGAAALTGKSATHSSVTAALKTPDLGLIYFATHGIADGVNPMDGSFLALAQKHLLAREIKALKFFRNHPLVVMSACQTGLGKVFEGGVFGLARAWYHAGAPQVVVSLWNIDDRATKSLMVDFMRALIDKEEAPEQALRSAMREARKHDDDPALWSGFAVYGGASESEPVWGSTRSLPNSSGRP